MPVKAGPTGAASWVAVNQFLDILERHHPGVRAETFALAEAAKCDAGEDMTGAIIALLRDAQYKNAP